MTLTKAIEKDFGSPFLVDHNQITKNAYEFKMKKSLVEIQRPLQCKIAAY